MEAYFKFKGIDSRDFGILIAAMPDIVKPKRREEIIDIPGRNGELIIDEDCYESHTLSIECGKRGTDRMGQMLAWLDGGGELSLSTEPGKVYRARVANAIPIQDVVYLYNSFLVQFRVQPFKYSANPFNDTLTLTAPQTVYNSGTIYSEPIITLYGTGNVVLVVNGKSYGLKNVSGSITVDSERMEAYKGDVNCNNQFQAVEFPRFEVGENTVSWTGNVTRVEIEPQWRWL